MIFWKKYYFFIIQSTCVRIRKKEEKGILINSSKKVNKMTSTYIGKLGL